MYLCRPYVAGLYTNLPDLQAALSPLFSFYCFYLLFDGNKCACCGAMRGLAKQGHAAWSSFIAYYVIGLPLQYLFGFHLGFGVLGLWYAQTCGALFQLASLAYVLYRRYSWADIA